MRAHILQHTSSTTPGSTIEWLRSEKIPFTVTQFFEPNAILPDLSSFDFLVICGGEMNVDEETKYPWLRAEKEFIKSALEKNKKVIGLCLGGQLMAEVLGAKVGKHKTWEAGWWPVQLKSFPQQKVPFVSELSVFQFHGYSFETPKDAFNFASSEACEHQGFLWGSSAIGLQFHPESTQEWVLECAHEKHPLGSFVQSASQMIEGNINQPMLQNWYFKLLNFLKNS